MTDNVRTALAELRALGLTYPLIARSLGVHPVTVKRWASGKRHPPFGWRVELRRVASHYGYRLVNWSEQP